MYICSGYGFLFPACNASANTTIHGLEECHIYHHVTPYTIASDQGAHFSWARGHGIHLSCLVSHRPEVAGLIEEWLSLLRHGYSAS